MNPENVIPAITLMGAGNLAIVATCRHHHHVSHVQTILPAVCALEQQLSPWPLYVFLLI
jgi:hypothetical protein